MVEFTNAGNTGGYIVPDDAAPIFAPHFAAEGFFPVQRADHRGGIMTELPLVEVLSIPVATITSDPSKLRVLIRMRSHPSVEGRERLAGCVKAWLAGETQSLILHEDAELSFVLLDSPERPIIVEANR